MSCLLLPATFLFGCFPEKLLPFCLEVSFCVFLGFDLRLVIEISHTLEQMYFFPIRKKGFNGRMVFVHFVEFVNPDSNIFSDSFA
jgi:hypothetical protein